MATERPSRTALKIARFMLLLDAVPELRGVLPPDSALVAEKLLRASSAVHLRYVEMMRKPSTLKFYRFAERLTGQGQLLWFGLRKRWFADTVEETIRGGAKQLLVVGAGFDPLATRMAQLYPDVLCVEVDAPATSLPKARGVSEAGLARENLVLCAADLSKTPLADALGTTPWRKDVKSVVVAEGLVMYLARADVEAFFTAVRACVPVGSRLALSSMDADDEGNPHLGTLDLPIRIALRLAGEPLRWGLRASDASAFVGAHGYRLTDQPTLENLRMRYLEPLGQRDVPVLPYEHLVAAETTGQLSAPSRR